MDPLTGPGQYPAMVDMLMNATRAEFAVLNHMGTPNVRHNVGVVIARRRQRARARPDAGAIAGAPPPANAPEPPQVQNPDENPGAAVPPAAQGDPRPHEDEDEVPDAHPVPQGGGDGAPPPQAPPLGQPDQGVHNPMHADLPDDQNVNQPAAGADGVQPPQVVAALGDAVGPRALVIPNPAVVGVQDIPPENRDPNVPPPNPGPIPPPGGAVDPMFRTERASLFYVKRFYARVPWWVALGMIVLNLIAAYHYVDYRAGLRSLTQRATILEAVLAMSSACTLGVVLAFLRGEIGTLRMRYRTIRFDTGPGVSYQNPLVRATEMNISRLDWAQNNRDTLPPEYTGEDRNVLVYPAIFRKEMGRRGGSTSSPELIRYIRGDLLMTYSEQLVDGRVDLEILLNTAYYTFQQVCSLERRERSMNSVYRANANATGSLPW